MEVIEYAGTIYPKLQSEGFASQYAFAFAKKMCKGYGVDIGYSKPEWKFPGAIGIDEGKMFIETDPQEVLCSVSATDLIYSGPLDYIFSSHCLEHLHDWVGVLDYWTTKLRSGGVMFLYLPNCDYQEYWRPWSNRKHVNWLTPDMLEEYFMFRGWKNIFVTKGYDLNGSFYAVAEKV